MPDFAPDGQPYLFLLADTIQCFVPPTGRTVMDKDGTAAARVHHLRLESRGYIVRAASSTNLDPNPIFFGVGNEGHICRACWDEDRAKDRR